jgi:uncharacterized protein (TIGR03067 family)
MRTLTPVILMAGVLTVGCTGKQDVSAELKNLEGTWELISLTKDGQQVPAAVLKSTQVVIKGDKYWIKFGNEVKQEGTITIDPTRKPKTIDDIAATGTNKGKKSLGIYELEGDTLKTCFADPGKERPTEFTSKPGSGFELATQKRKKP